jgi:hypothetical protein
MMYPHRALNRISGKDGNMKSKGIRSMWVAAMALLAPSIALAAAGPALPGDARLLPVRAELQTLVDHAAQVGLPAELLLSKVQEGLAKQVPPPRIVQVVRTLSDDLGAARSFAQPLVPGGRPQAALLRALCEAKAAGVNWSDTAPLLRGQSGDAPVRALVVLTDLASRGYPANHAVAVVAVVVRSEPQSLPRLPATLDRLRRGGGLTQAEALDALARALSSSRDRGAGSLDQALRKVDDGSDRSGTDGAQDRSRGPNRDSSGHHGKGH